MVYDIEKKWDAPERINHVVINAGVLQYPSVSVLPFPLDLKRLTISSAQQKCKYFPRPSALLGQLSPLTPAKRSFDRFDHHLQNNAIGPILTARHLMASPLEIDTLTFVSSDSGSTQAFRDFEDGFAAYAASKAALNQALRHLDAEIKRKGERETCVLALHPGEVETDMVSTILFSSCLMFVSAKGLRSIVLFSTCPQRARRDRYSRD